MNSLKPIWLVEDSADDIELTLAALEDIHLANRVVAMRDGSQVMERLEACSDMAALPIVVLLDIKMPKVSGIDVLRRIKSAPRFEEPAGGHAYVVAPGRGPCGMLRSRSQRVCGQTGGVRRILRSRKDGREILGDHE
jgi:CheY-like chemotaxis protein